MHTKRTEIPSPRTSNLSAGVAGGLLANVARRFSMLGGGSRRPSASTTKSPDDEDHEHYNDDDDDDHDDINDHDDQHKRRSAKPQQQQQQQPTPRGQHRSNASIMRARPISTKSSKSTKSTQSAHQGVDRVYGAEPTDDEVFDMSFDQALLQSLRTQQQEQVPGDEEGGGEAGRRSNAPADVTYLPQSQSLPAFTVAEPFAQQQQLQQKRASNLQDAPRRSSNMSLSQAGTGGILVEPRTSNLAAATPPPPSPSLRVSRRGSNASDATHQTRSRQGSVASSVGSTNHPPVAPRDRRRSGMPDAFAQPLTPAFGVVDELVDDAHVEAIVGDAKLEPYRDMLRAGAQPEAVAEAMLFFGVDPVELFGPSYVVASAGFSASSLAMAVEAVDSGGNTTAFGEVVLEQQQEESRTRTSGLMTTEELIQFEKKRREGAKKKTAASPAATTSPNAPSPSSSSPVKATKQRKAEEEQRRKQEELEENIAKLKRIERERAAAAAAAAAAEEEERARKAKAEAEQKAREEKQELARKNEERVKRLEAERSAGHPSALGQQSNSRATFPSNTKQRPPAAGGSEVAPPLATPPARRLVKASNAVVIEGSLLKKTKGGQWHSRQFFLKGRELQWLRSDQKTVCAMDLSQPDAAVRDIPVGLKRFMFEVTVPGGLPALTLSAAGEAEKTMWMRRIREAIRGSAGEDDAIVPASFARLPTKGRVGNVRGENEAAIMAGLEKARGGGGGGASTAASPTSISTTATTSTTTPCHRCGLAVFKVEEVVMQGHTFHKKCFTCAQCGRTLAVSTIAAQPSFEGGGKLYCRQHDPLAAVVVSSTSLPASAPPLARPAIPASRSTKPASSTDAGSAASSSSIDNTAALSRPMIGSGKRRQPSIKPRLPITSSFVRIASSAGGLIPTGESGERDRMRHDFTFKLVPDPSSPAAAVVIWMHASSQYERDHWVNCLCAAIQALEMRGEDGRGSSDLQQFLDSHETTYSGFLEKLSIKSHRNWKRRWFELTSAGELRYSADDKSKKPKHVIPLRSTSVVLGWDDERLSGPLYL